MPITKGTIKRLRQSIVRNARNTSRVNAYKKAIKAVKVAITAGKIDGIAVIQRAYKMLDLAAKYNSISAQKASRKKKQVASMWKEAGGKMA